jgi:hypothetical protein
VINNKGETMKVNYKSNNSGGHWWLEDKDWFALEAAGWQVEWYKNQTNGIFGCNKNGRFLGALASEATKEFDSIEAAVAEFEKITGQCADDVGCSCCGSPHYFSKEWAE